MGECTFILYTNLNTCACKHAFSRVLQMSCFLLHICTYLLRDCNFMRLLEQIIIGRQNIFSRSFLQAEVGLVSNSFVYDTSDLTQTYFCNRCHSLDKHSRYINLAYQLSQTYHSQKGKKKQAYSIVRGAESIICDHNKAP